MLRPHDLRRHREGVVQLHSVQNWQARDRCKRRRRQGAVVWGRMPGWGSQNGDRLLGKLSTKEQLALELHGCDILTLKQHLKFFHVLI